MNPTPPPTHLTEASQPAPVAGGPTGRLADTGPAGDILALGVLGVSLLVFGCACVVAALFENLAKRRRTSGHLPSHPDQAWIQLVEDGERSGLPTDIAEVHATRRLGWEPGDRR